jgi:acetyltransferase
MPHNDNLPALFAPKSVAVIGASRHADKIGNLLVSNLIQSGFAGKIFPVNPGADSIRGLPALRKTEDIPADCRPLDLGVICLPAEKAAAAMEELAALPTRAVIVISAGFKETGGRGARREDALAQLAERHRMALLGPNSLGLINCAQNVNASFITGIPACGDIGFFSQSGAFCAAIFDWAREQNFGFSSFVSLGNKARIDESDVLVHLADDVNTKVIAGYLESVEDGPRFVRGAHIATRKKPVILLKGGRGEAGARAAASHTGARCSMDGVYDAAFRQTGIIRARRMEDLFSLARAFASQPLPAGPGLAVVTNAGGLGTLAADACEASGLTLANLSRESLRALKESLPSYASIYNPVDVADVMTQSPERVMAEAAAIVLRDASVHSLLILAAPTAHTSISAVARNIIGMALPRHKPVFACLAGGPGVGEARRLFTSARIPCYLFPELAVDAIAAMYRQSLWKESPLPVEIGYRCDPARARAVIDEARAGNGRELTAFLAQKLLRAYEIPLLEVKLARTSDEAVHIARQIGSPVALKIDSPQIPHKSDIRGVALYLDTPDKIRAAFLDITSRARRLHKDAYIAGCLVQPMAPEHSRETVLGFTRDPNFGPLVFFGLGGIHRAAFKAVSYRLAPLSLDDVHDMVREGNAFPILAGMPGEKSVKFTAIEDILLILSQMALAFPDIEACECNPVLADHDGALVADARIILGETAKTGQAPDAPGTDMPEPARP